MALSTSSKDAMENMMLELGLNKERLKDGVKVLKEWLKQQPHLPNEIEDCRLEVWLFCWRNSLERTKSSLDTYYTLKNIVPEYLTDFIPNDPWYRNITNAVFSVPLPTLTAEHNRVIVCGFQNQDASKYNQNFVCKLACMYQEVRNIEDYHLEDIFIVDLANYTAGITPKLSLPALKKGQVCLAKCYGLKVHSIHFINSPSYIEIILGIARTVLSPKLVERIHVHSGNLDSLHEIVPKKILPNEYGGEAGPVNDLWASWKNHVESYKDWFLDQDKFKSDESKRPGKAINNGEIFGFEGSFRQLSLD